MAMRGRGPYYVPREDWCESCLYKGPARQSVIQTRSHAETIRDSWWAIILAPFAVCCRRFGFRVRDERPTFMKACSWTTKATLKRSDHGRPVGDAHATIVIAVDAFLKSASERESRAAGISGSRFGSRHGLRSIRIRSLAHSRE